MSQPPITIVCSQDWAPRIGGAHYWLQQVYRRWDGPVVVLTATPAGSEQAGRGGSDASVVHRTAEPVDTVGFRPGTWWPILRNARAIRRLAAGRPFEVHCKAWFPEGLIGILACMGAGRSGRSVVYAHGEEVLVARSSRLFTFLARLVYARAGTVIVNSRNTERLVLDLQPKARTVVVHPGVDARSGVVTPQERERFRAAQDIAASSMLVLSLGRMEPRKNFIAVMRAVERARSRGLDVVHVCIGAGEDRGRAEAHRRELGEPAWLRILDPVDESAKRMWLAAADLFAMPSVQRGEMIEGFGMVFLEAAASGVPSISGLSGGQCEAVIDGRTGWNVDGESVDAIEAAILKRFGDEAMRQSMAAHCRDWALEHDWDRVVSRIRKAIADAPRRGELDGVTRGAELRQ